LAEKNKYARSLFLALFIINLPFRLADAVFEIENTLFDKRQSRAKSDSNERIKAKVY